MTSYIFFWWKQTWMSECKKVQSNSIYVCYEAAPAFLDLIDSIKLLSCFLPKLCNLVISQTLYSIHEFYWKTDTNYHVWNSCVRKWIPNIKKGKIKNFFFDILVPISLRYMHFNIILYFFKCKSISIYIYIYIYFWHIFTGIHK